MEEVERRVVSERQALAQERQALAQERQVQSDELEASRFERQQLEAMKLNLEQSPAPA